MLKLLAIIFMTVDHVGLFMLDNNVFMRIIGRLALPIFVYMAVQGLKNTKNLRKYFLRLMVFAIISQPVYLLFNNKLNILFGLLCSIAFIKAIDVKKPVIGLIILPIMFLCEYGIYTLILAMLFYGCSRSEGPSK
jgi:hypothetical protein